MNYREWQLCSLVVGVAFVTTTALGQMQGQPVPLPGLAQAPQVKDNFKVVIQKGTNSTTGTDFEFFYVFCKVNDIIQTNYLNPIVREKKMSAKTKTKTFSGGFSKLVEGSTLSQLVGSSPATSGNPTEYIRLLVSKNWKALSAKRQGKPTTEQQDKAIFVSEPVKRYSDKCGIVTAGRVGSIIGRVVFTIDEDIAPLNPSGLKVTFKDDRTCRSSKISKAAKAKAATGSAYDRATAKARELKQSATTKAKSAWDSTKRAATTAKEKVSSAASRAKASVTKRFGK